MDDLKNGGKYCASAARWLGKLLDNWNIPLEPPISSPEVFRHFFLGADHIG